MSSSNSRIESSNVGFDPSKNYSSMDTFKKAFKSHAVWIEKDEFLDVIYWMRQILGIFFGLIWGFIPLTGILGLALFFLCNAGIVYIYFSGFQGVDEEEYGGVWELIKEGFMTSFAGFLVTWIVIYSGLHYSDSELLHIIPSN